MNKAPILDPYQATCTSEQAAAASRCLQDAAHLEKLEAADHSHSLANQLEPSVGEVAVVYRLQQRGALQGQG